MDVAAHIVKPVVNWRLKSVVVASWDMKTEAGILIRLNVRSRCAASETDNWKHAPIALIILPAKQFRIFTKKAAINIRNTSSQLNLSEKTDMPGLWKLPMAGKVLTAG